MLGEIKYFYEKNSVFLQRNQTQQLLLYAAFVLRFSNKFNIEFDNSRSMEGILPELFKNIQGYEIKEAVSVFDSFMPWSIVQQNEDLRKSLDMLFHELYKKEAATVEWFLDTINQIFPDGAATPRAVRRLTAGLAAQKDVRQISDLCCGTFLLGLDIWNEMGRKDEIFCYGEDSDAYMCAVSRLLLFLCDVKNFSVCEEDVLRRTCNIQNGGLPRVIAAELPLVGSRTVIFEPEEESLKKENKRTLYTDWMIIYKILRQLNDGERAFLIVTKGALVRENERFLRKYYVDENYVDAVITLPKNMYPNCNSPMNLLIFEKKRSSEKNRKVLFADLGKLSSLSDDTIDKICRVFRERAATEKFARIIDYEKIAQEGYMLDPMLYMTNNILSEHPVIKDIATVTRGLQDSTECRSTNQTERYLLNVRDIQDGEIVYETAEIIKGGNPLWERKYLIKEDDIIITSKGASLKLAIVPPNPMPAYISGNLMLLRVDKKMYSPYVLYEYLLSENGQLALSLIQTGTTIRVLGVKKTEQLAIPNYERETAILVGDGLKLASLLHKKEINEADMRLRSKKEELLSKLKTNKGKGE